MISDKEFLTVMKVLFLVVNDYRKRNSFPPEEKEALKDFIELCKRLKFDEKETSSN